MRFQKAHQKNNGQQTIQYRQENIPVADVYPEKINSQEHQTSRSYPRDQRNFAPGFKAEVRTHQQENRISD